MKEVIKILSQERYELILNFLKEKEIVKLQNIVEELGMSESTVRRDLNFLEKKALLERVHGGARLPLSNYEEDFESKNIQNLSQKKVIGMTAAKKVEDGDCIFLDAGTTIEAIIPYLKQNNIRVVTNGTTHIPLLGKMGIRTYILEGRIKHKTGAIVGSEAIESLLKYNFDKCFLGTNGVHLENGYTTPDIEEAEIKRRVIKNSKIAYIMADSSKFGKISFIRFGEIEDCIIITDKLKNKEFEKLTVVKECKL